MHCNLLPVYLNSTVTCFVTHPKSGIYIDARLALFLKTDVHKSAIQVGRQCEEMEKQQSFRGDQQSKKHKVLEIHCSAVFMETAPYECIDVDHVNSNV